MKEKILSFIYNQKTNKLLLLNMKKDPKHSPEGGWFTVTGSIEKNETQKEAVEREIMEETGLSVKRILPLNWGSVYSWNGEEFKEMNFLSFVNKEKVILNEEHLEYMWVSLNEFIKKIKWNENKNLLEKVIAKAIKGEIFFDKKERDQ